MYNKIILAGHLSKDIEIRYSQGGTAIANTAIATSRKFKAADGTQKEEVLFVDVSFYGRTAEIVNQYLHKGSKVLIDGRLKLDQWTDNQGQKRSKHKVDAESVQMLDSKPKGDQSPPPTQQPRPSAQTTRHHQAATAQPNPPHPPPSFPDMDMNEEIPF